VSEEAALPEKTLIFSDFPRQVYCALSGIRPRLNQTDEGEGNFLPDLHADLRQQTQRFSKRTRLGVRCRSIRWQWRLYPEHLSRRLKLPVRGTAGRIESGFQLGSRLDQSRGQRSAGEPQMAALAVGPQLRVRPWRAAAQSSLGGAVAAAGRRLDDDGLAGHEHDLRAGPQRLNASILAPDEIRAQSSWLAAIQPERPHAAEA
jgi:hypothetical protein